MPPTGELEGTARVNGPSGDGTQGRDCSVRPSEYRGQIKEVVQFPVRGTALPPPFRVSIAFLLSNIVDAFCL